MSLLPFNYIGEGSEATPGLWNSPLSILSANIASLGTQIGSGVTLSVLSDVSIGGGVFTAAPSDLSGVVTIHANSNVTDYLAFTDSSAARSSYLLGSHIGGTLDGLNLYDTSGNTMIVGFSKQSVRFYQSVFAPIFDAGGATFNVKSFGALGDGIADDAAAFNQAISAASAIGGGIVIVPSSQSPYRITSTLTLIPNLTISGGGGFNPQINFSNASGILFSFLGTSEAQGFGTTIQNLTLFNTTAKTGVACRIRNFENFYVNNVVFSNWSLGVWTDWGIGTFVTGCQLSSCKRAVMAGGPGLAGGIRSVNSAFMDTVVVRDSVFAQNLYDIVHHGSYFAEGVLVVDGCSFFESSSNSLSGKTENIHLSNLKSPYLTGNWFENPNVGRTAVVLTDVDSDGTTFPLLGVRGGAITANDFLGTNTSYIGVLAEYGGGTLISGNNFEVQSASSAVVLTATKNPFYVIANNYLTYSEATTPANPIASASSIHFILEPSNLTSSMGTVNFRGVVSIDTFINFTTVPPLQFGSNRSTGFYMPAAGTLNWTGVGFGVNQTQGLGATLDVNGTSLLRGGVRIMGASTLSDGSAIAPAYSFRSDTSLGLYRSGVSTVAMSYGTLNLATQAVRFSMRTLAASSVTASAAKTNVAVDEVVFTIGGASGASLIIYSGGTAYGFNSAFSAAAS